MGMRGERHMWLSCIVFIAHAQHNTTRTINMDRGKRAWEGSEQSAYLGWNVTESEQHREDSSRDLELECRKG